MNKVIDFTEIVKMTGNWYRGSPSQKLEIYERENIEEHLSDIGCSSISIDDNDYYEGDL